MVVGVSATTQSGAARPVLGLANFALKIRCSFEVVGTTAQQQSDDESEEAEDRREDLNDQDLDETSDELVIRDHACVRPLTYSEGSAASAKAALEPLIPTLTPQIKLHMPTSTPLQNNA